MARDKVAIIGAGNVGGACAQWIAAQSLADIVLIDVVEGLAKGTALDLFQAGLLTQAGVAATGGSDYSLIEGAAVVVVTAGVPRRKDPQTGKFPSRDELVKINQEIVAGVSRNIARYAPDSIILVVSNPLDAMCHVTLHESGFAAPRVIGQAGALDVARYKAFIAQALGVSVHDVQGTILGGHGDQMVPLTRLTSVGSIPIRELMDAETLQAIVERTRKGGGELVNLMGYSAFFAPAAGVTQMAAAILQDQKRVLPCSVYLTGQYGCQNLYIGVPVVLGANGVERVLEIELTPEEQKQFDQSAQTTREVVAVLGY